MFSKAKGGIVGLAQGGRIGMAKGVGRQDPMGGWAHQTSAEMIAAAPDQFGGGMTISHGGSGDGVTKPPVLPKIKPRPNKDNLRTGNPVNNFFNWLGDKTATSNLGMWNNAMQQKNYLAHLEATNPEAYAETLADLMSMNYATRDVEFYGPKNKFDDYEDPMSPGRDVINFTDLGDPQSKAILNAVGPENLYNQYLNRGAPTHVEARGGQGEESGLVDWQRLGYPSYGAYLAAQGGGGGGGGTGTGGVGDYYGFKEWEDWEGAPTTPLFGDATSYQGLLSKGGRIGLYAGGMGAMNNPMNPMMNQGLGAMGSRGMNPYNQQNLMNQAQMRGQPTGGRPPMPGGPNMAQGPGITGTQASAALAKKEEDGELLQLIKMLASMGIPMEQLRGRTKEELVEMVMSISAKAQAQRGGGGGEEVVEESEEEVVEANRGGLTRTGYAMGTEQPIIPSRDGPQIDYRGIGGYQPHGAKEKKDDVRALLAQGEFVVTSDAVKGIGGGDRDLGAKRMYDMMHKYEPIGRALG